MRKSKKKIIISIAIVLFPIMLLILSVVHVRSFRVADINNSYVEFDEYAVDGGFRGKQLFSIDKHADIKRGDSYYGLSSILFKAPIIFGYGGEE